MERGSYLKGIRSRTGIPRCGCLQGLDSLIACCFHAARHRRILAWGHDCVSPLPCASDEYVSMTWSGGCRAVLVMVLASVLVGVTGSVVMVVRINVVMGPGVKVVVSVLVVVVSFTDNVLCAVLW